MDIANRPALFCQAAEQVGLFDRDHLVVGDLTFKGDLVARMIFLILPTGPSTSPMCSEAW